MLNHLRDQREIPLGVFVGLISNALTMRSIDDRYAEEQPIIEIRNRRYRVANFKSKLSR